MNDPDKTAPHPGPGEKPDDEDLDGALNALEDMLENRHVVPEHAAHAPQGERAPGPKPFALEQEDLPLLDEVVIPGNPVPERDRLEPTVPQLHEPHGSQGSPRVPQYYDLMARLVNEMNVIVESSIDDALSEAKREVLARLKNHLDIVLPEIVDELLQRCEDLDDDSGA
jgi:hypothetical protein